MFTIASLICGLAQEASLLIAGRAIAGTGSAFMLSAGLALLVQVFHGQERIRAFAIWGVVVCAGSALGPLVGGLLTDNLGWRWIFFINLPICLPLLWISQKSARESYDPQSGTIDWVGLVSFTAMFLLVMYALIEGNRLGWSSAPLIGLLTTAALLLLLFIGQQLRHSRPMFDFSLFTNPSFTGASIVAIAIAAAFFTLLVYLPIYIQGVLNYTPTQTGFALVVMAVPLLIMGPVSARMAAILSPKLFLPLGLAIIAAGAFALSMITHYPTFALYSGMIITGIGAGLGAIFSANLTRGLAQYDQAVIDHIASGDLSTALTIAGNDRAAHETGIAVLTLAISNLALSAAVLALTAALCAFILIHSKK